MAAIEKELTLRAVVLGTLLGLIFTVGNAYLGLRIGTTVSASIPSAVIAMALLSRRGKSSILESNIVQTIASVGEGLAAGVIFTVPALFLLGEPPSPLRIALLSFLGGVLGILFMIPMRRYIIIHEHKHLPFPEGTACAEILKSQHGKKEGAGITCLGIATGALYKLCTSLFHLFDELVNYTIAGYEKTLFSIECTPSLLGVGYIVGPRTASLIFTGGAMAWWVLIPVIRFFGSSSSAIVAPADIPLDLMSAEKLWSSYIRYIGAGAVATGGIYSLLRIAPMIKKTFVAGCKELFSSRAAHSSLAVHDRDISLRYLIIGSIAIVMLLWLWPGLSMNFVTIALLTILGFFFVAVTSLTVGIVGSTSNPVSGMTITTLLITCLIFLGLGWTERIFLLGALTMSVVVNVAIALAATTSQDLKTGFLLKATPKKQQIAEIVGLILPAVAAAGTLTLLGTTMGFGTAALPAPQATMLTLIATGVLKGSIPIVLMTVGAVLALLIRVLGLPILPFAIGLYLPLSLSTPIMLGGLVCLWVKKKSTKTVSQRGVLAASGLIAGDACTGVIVTMIIAATPSLSPTSFRLPSFTGLIVFSLYALFLAKLALYKTKAKD